MTALAGSMGMGVGKDEDAARAGAFRVDIFMILTDIEFLQSKKSCYAYFLNYAPEKRLRSKKFVPKIVLQSLPFCTDLA